jgi:murein DD-endopeptidase MepM/ murein hydrolase activator NlpD
VSPVDISCGKHSQPRRRLVRQLVCGGLVGALGIVPAAGTAWALDGDPPPAHHQQHGPGHELYGTDARAAGPHGREDEPWEPEPQGDEFDPGPEFDPGLDTGLDPGPDPGLDPEMPEPETDPLAEEPLEGPPGSWAKPVAYGRVSAAYGIPGSWIAGHHTGIDLAVPVGTPVRAVGSGVVIQAGRGGDYGLMVLMRMDDGRYTLFAHLSKVLVRPGKRVKTGTLIGYSGNTGRTTGPHLHFEVRKTGKYGSDINPVSYLASKGVRL